MEQARYAAHFKFSSLAKFCEKDLEVLDEGRRIYRHCLVDDFEFDKKTGLLYGYVWTDEKEKVGVELKIHEEYGVVDAHCQCHKGKQLCEHQAAVLTAAVVANSKKIETS